MDLRVIWSSPVRALLLVAISAIVAQPCLAAVDSGQNGLIEIEYPVEALLPYRERRPKNQLTLHFQYENFLPNGYISPTVGTTYGETYKNVATPLISGSIGWKHNIPFLGLEVAAFYGNGGLADTQMGEKVTFDVSKYGLKFAGYLETLFKEPYVVPYGAVQVQGWDVSEIRTNSKYERTTSYNVGFQVGALIQLNWLEQDSSLAALNESGLTNTYLDIFAQQYGNTSDAADPKMASEFNWGAGFRVEY